MKTRSAVSTLPGVLAVPALVFAVACAGDPGISRGPFNYDCEGLPGGVSVSFVQADPASPGVAQLQWREETLTLAQQVSASGARYVGQGTDGEYTFWDKGGEATFIRPGGESSLCRVASGPTR